MRGISKSSGQPNYPYYQENGIPEIQDLNVLPKFRRQGIATQLLDEAESRIAQRADIVGIGFSLYADYGAAQRLYFLRGYIPDGYVESPTKVLILNPVQLFDLMTTWYCTSSSNSSLYPRSLVSSSDIASVFLASVISVVGSTSGLFFTHKVRKFGSCAKFSSGKSS